MKDTDTAQTTWTPDTRWALPVVLSVWVWALGWLPQWAGRVADPPVDGPGFPPLLMIGFGVTAGLVGVWRARTAWSVDHYGESLREQGSLLAVVSGLALAVWLVLAGYTSPWEQTPLLLMISGVLGALFAALTSTAPRHATAEAERTAVIAEQDQHEAVRTLLDDSDCAAVRIYDVTETRAGYTVTLGPDPAYARRPKYADVLRQLDDIELNLGIYWRRKNGTVLDEGDVRLEPVAVDRWLLHVSTRHVLSEHVEYRPEPEPRSWNMPVWLGLFEDGAQMRVALCGQHVKIVGATGGGKSTVIHNIVARALESRSADGRPDALVWLAATAKLVPLSYPWLLPWLEGRTQRPALDWVIGEDPSQVRRFLLALWDLVNDRVRRLGRLSEHAASPELPGIVAIIEEATALLTDDTPIQMDEDATTSRMWTASQLLCETAALARAAGVSIIVAAQSGMYDALGRYGSDLMRHLTVRICTRTTNESDGRFTLPSLPAKVDTTRLKHKSVYLQNGIDEESRAMPGKVAALTSARVPAAAEALSVSQAVLGPRDVAALGGEYYEQRWDEARCATLADAARCDTQAPGGDGFEWPTVGGSTSGSDPLPDPVDPPEESPVHTPQPEPAAPEPEPIAPDEVDWDAELAELLGQPRPAARGGDDGLPGDEEIAELHGIAARIERESEAMAAAEPAAAAPADVLALLPQPLRSVIAYLDGLDDRPEWVSTTTLALAVLGEDVDNGGAKLGRALSLNYRDLRATEPRDVGDGKRARGYLVRDLYRAAVAIRDRPR